MKTDFFAFSCFDVRSFFQLKSSGLKLVRLEKRQVTEGPNWIQDTGSKAENKNTKRRAYLRFTQPEKIQVSMLTLFFSLHKGCASLEQVRWIAAATELATSRFTKNKTRRKGELSPGILLSLFCCWRCPLTCSKNIQDKQKKRTLVSTPTFFSNGMIKMTYPQIKILSKVCHFLQRTCLSQI